VLTSTDTTHALTWKHSNQIYINRGAGVFIRNRQAARIIIDWRTTRNVYTVAGQATGRAGANTNLYMDASGRYPLGNITTPKSSKRKLVELSRFPLFRKLQERKAAEEDGGAGTCELCLRRGEGNGNVDV
jgi:hypothetical protein